MESETNQNLGQTGAIDELPFRLTAILGDVVLSGRDVKTLSRGAKLNLNRVERSPLMVLANGQPIALAEPIIDEGQFAIRITAILNPEDRVRYRKFGQIVPYARIEPVQQ